MADPQAQAAAQLARILTQTGRDVAAHAQEVTTLGLETHGQRLKHFKVSLGLGHGDANRLAFAVKEHLEGGPPDPQALLDAQYAGAKAALRPLYERLYADITAMGDDVEVVIQKTGVSFRRAKQFALVQAPSAKRVQLGLNLDDTPDDPRVVPTQGMCTHKANLSAVEEVDEALAEVLAAAYARAG